MKKLVLSFLILIAMNLVPGFGRGSSAGNHGLEAQEINNPALASLTNHSAARDFIAGDVSKRDLERILTAGQRSPSANNRQSWHFTVVQSPNLIKQIVPNYVDGNVLIILSAPGDGKTNGSIILDCALAAQTMYLAAQAIGLGSRIYTGPIDTINSQFKAELGFPPGYNAVALVRIGQILQSVDGVSAASSRKNLDSIVTYK